MKILNQIELKILGFTIEGEKKSPLLILKRFLSHFLYDHFHIGFCDQCKSLKKISPFPVDSQLTEDGITNFYQFYCSNCYETN